MQGKYRVLLLLVLLIFSSASFSQVQQEELEQLMRRQYSDGDAPGGVLGVSVGGETCIVAVGVRDVWQGLPIDEHTNFRLASVSKQYTAWAAVHALNAHGLSIDVTIDRWFPELASPAAAIRVADLINHSSGVPDYEDRIPADQTDQLSDADVLGLIAPLDTLYFKPGSQFRYSNTGYCLLTLLVERLTGIAYADYLKAYLFEPMKLIHSQVFQPSDSIVNRAYGYRIEEQKAVFADQSVTSATKGDGGIYTSTHDFHRFNRFIQDTLLFDAGTGSAQAVSPEVNYWMGLFQAKTIDGQDVYFHSGETTGFRHVFLRIPQRDLVVSLFTNRDDTKLAAVFDAVLDYAGVDIPALGTENLFHWLSRVYAHQLTE